MNILFSDQSTLSFIKNSKYKTFYNVLVSEKVERKEFQRYDIPNLDYLIKEKVLAEDEIVFCLLDISHQTK